MRTDDAEVSKAESLADRKVTKVTCGNWAEPGPAIFGLTGTYNLPALIFWGKRFLKKVRDDEGRN
jgi:hypothetical protein